MSREEAFEAYFDGKAIRHKTFGRGKSKAIKSNDKMMENKIFWLEHMNILYHQEKYKTGWSIVTP
jgi:hypothetical protein